MKRKIKSEKRYSSTETATANGEPKVEVQPYEPEVEFQIPLNTADEVLTSFHISGDHCCGRSHE